MVMQIMQTILKQKVTRTNEVLGWPSRIMGFTRVLGGTLFFALLFNSVQAFSTTVPAGQSVTLTWNLNTDPNVAGCNVYYGVSSHNYTNVINVGNVTNTTVSGLVAGVTYYFAATAYDSLGGQSDYSNEAIYTVPTTLSKMQIRSAPAGQFILTVSGLIGQTYEIEATQDSKTWTVIGTVALDASSSLDFTDTNAASFPHRFYRAQETP